MKKLRKCIYCKTIKSVDLFGPKHSYGHTYMASICRECDNARPKRKKDPDNRRHYNKLYARKRRASGIDIVGDICKDSRQSDRRRGRENDITREFVAGLISGGCQYCGEQQLRISMDRIDNRRGHLKDNVVPACIRCNLLRRDMPHIAWLQIAPAMRIARERGLFGNWTGKIR